MGKIELEFLDGVTFAPADEIIHMLQTVLDEDYGGLPVWARNLAYRLACLQRPDDAPLLREAAVDLYNHGPDWDEKAAELQRRAQATTG